MMTFILIIHSLVCVLLLLAILMQAGRGGGLTEQFASAESVFGAQTNVFMVRTTSILATIFFFTCLSLAFMSARQERSLVAERSATQRAAGATLPSAAQPVAPVEKTGQTAQPSSSTPEPVMPEKAVKSVESSPEVQTPVTTNAQ